MTGDSLPPPSYLAASLAGDDHCTCPCGCDKRTSPFPAKFARQAKRARTASLHSRTACPACLAGEHLSLTKEPR